MFSPIENPRVVSAIIPSVNNSSQIGAYISLKNVNKAYIVVSAVLEATTAITIYPYQATAVAGTGAKVFSTDGNHNLNWWLCSAATSEDTLTKQTAAATNTFQFSSSTGKGKLMVIEVPTGMLDLANGFDCLSVRTAVGTTGDLISVQYYLNMRYAEGDAVSSVFGD